MAVIHSFKDAIVAAVSFIIQLIESQLIQYKLNQWNDNFTLHILAILPLLEVFTNF
jgi:hypothetical protein